MIKISTLTVTASLLAVAAQADKWSDQFPHIKNTGDIAGECSYESMSKKDYSGQKLTINTHAVPVIGEPTALHAEQFSKLTGAEVNVIHTPAGDLYSKAMVPFQAGQAPYDIVFGSQTSLEIGNSTYSQYQPNMLTCVKCKMLRKVTLMLTHGMVR